MSAAGTHLPQTSDYVPEVRAQYEALPYPPWKPEDEARRLARTWLDDLPMINHYGFAGRQTFREHFRALVAGGGTGDATIFLAEQLKSTDAEIVHVDLSEASLAIARERARIRKLENITFVHQSLLALPALGWEPFDYVNCVGVLHHLDDPDAGLRALLAVLKPEGVLGLMVYATYGRTGVYQLQALLRLLAGPDAALAQRLATARRVLASLPPTNGFKRGESMFRDHVSLGDAGLFDLLLHARDRAYTVGELYAWLADRHGLHIELTDVQRGRSAYVPGLTLGPEPAQVAAEIDALPPRQRYEAAELLSGSITMHTLYATRGASRVAPYGDADYVPFFFHEPVSGPMLAAIVKQNGDRPFLLTHQHTGVRVQANPGRYGRYVLQHIDGRRTFEEIFDAVRAEPAWRATAPANAVLFDDFRPMFEILAAIDRLLLRHRDAPLPA